MDIQEYQEWICQFYKDRQWYEYNPFIRVNFLSEEVGEVARAIRAIEIGRDRPDEIVADHEDLLKNLEEEIGDVLDNLVILADKYGMSLESIMASHQDKLLDRYRKS